MNSQGQLRKYIANKCSTDEFTEYIAICIGREFDVKIEYLNRKAEYIFILDKITVRLTKAEAKKLHSKNPYAIDRYILDSFMKNGFNFVKEKSQYLRSVYGIVLN